MRTRRLTPSTNAKQTLADVYFENETDRRMAMGVSKLRDLLRKDVPPCHSARNSGVRNSASHNGISGRLRHVSAKAKHLRYRKQREN
jgi:hypothetical protein